MTAPNPGHLKLELALNGVDVDACAQARPELRMDTEESVPLPPSVELLLPEDVVVDTRIANRTEGRQSAGSVTSPYQLGCEAEQFVLRRDAEHVKVRVIPRPQFYERTTQAGTPMCQVGSVFGGFICISPLQACGFSLRRGICSWCGATTDAEFKQLSAPARQRIPDVVETVRAALAEGAVEFVLFNSGASAAGPEDDGGVADLEPYIRAVKRHFDTFVAVQVHPPASDRWVDRTYAMGVDALCYSVEIYDPALLAQFCPGRVSRIGRERYYEALAHAATVFPSGTVWSDLVVGLEPAESTRRGIDALTSAGVLPVLSLARPLDGPGPSGDGPALDEIIPVAAHLFHAVREAKINMGWVRDLSFAVTPLEARFFAGDDARLTVAQQFYRSRLGTMTARNLARLRRRLRVRTVSDSFDSSRL